MLVYQQHYESGSSRTRDLTVSNRRASFVPFQLPLSPMRVFAIGIEQPARRGGGVISLRRNN
jgi:hypothetical protein